jgi:hypothetical protein
MIKIISEIMEECDIDEETLDFEERGASNSALKEKEFVNDYRR